MRERVRSKVRARLVELNQRKDTLLAYRDDPVGFIKQVLGEFIWSKQAEIAEAVVKHRRVAVPACHGLGKSFLASRIASWWVSTSPVGDAFAVTSAPTEKQVKAILWREINRAFKKGSLPGRVNQTEWFIDNELVGYGRKPADTDMTGFQGIHAKRLLVLLDEACGIPKAIYTGADSLMTSEESRMLAIGNPDDPSSEFANICKPGSGWHVIPVSAFQTPNMTGEVVPDTLRSLLTSRVWVEEKDKQWGKTSPLYLSKVLGQFPDVSDDGLISAAWVNRALASDLQPGPDDPVELGVDVARFGVDETVIAMRCGPRASIVHAHRNRDLMTVVGKIVEFIRTCGASIVKIDDAGLGGGVTDRLKELVEEAQNTIDPETGKLKDPVLAAVKVYAINVGSGAQDKEKFVNLRAELHWALRERFEAGDIALEADDVMAGQLCAPKYKLTSRGQVQIESKEDMKKRLGTESGFSSPDRADAIMLAFAPKPFTPGDGIFDYFEGLARVVEETERQEAEAKTSGQTKIGHTPAPDPNDDGFGGYG